MTEPERSATPTEKLRELAKRVNCDDVLLGVLCPRCHADGTGCLRAWALKEEWPDDTVVREPLFSERKMFTPRDLDRITKQAVAASTLELHNEIARLKQALENQPTCGCGVDINGMPTFCDEHSPPSVEEVRQASELLKAMDGLVATPRFVFDDNSGSIHRVEEPLKEPLWCPCRGQCDYPYCVDADSEYHDDKCALAFVDAIRSGPRISPR